VGEWLKEGKDGQVFYGDRWISRQNFVTWPQVREMVASGLVEVASHSHSLHKGVISNPQGSRPSSATTRIYDANNQHYESDGEFIKRLRADLARNNALIARETGKNPRVMIWPYGAFNMLGVQAAEAEGMPIAMTLDPGPNTPDVSLNRMRREMLTFNDKVSDLKNNLLRQAQYDGREQPLDRIVAVDLETFYEPGSALQEQKIGELIEHIHQLRINVVYLRAVADLDHDGYADTAYFPNRHLPMQADMFNRVAWQLITRASSPANTFHVYAWMPILRYEKREEKISNRETIAEIYDEMAKNAPRINGLLLGYETEGFFNNPDLENFNRTLISAFKVHHPAAFTARFIPVSAQASKKKPEPFPILTHSIGRYDFITFGIPQAVTGEKTNSIDDYFKALTDKLALTPGGLDHTAFLLQATTNDTNPADAAKVIAVQLQSLQQNGVRNYGFYPYQLIRDKPAFLLVKPSLSLHTNPGHSL
jgi:biofilm PGA synthesis lipoprotein PgaB